MRVRSINPAQSSMTLCIGSNSEIAESASLHAAEADILPIQPVLG
jgi:hypothetical protein